MIVTDAYNFIKINLVSLILALAIAAGQLIKISIGGSSGPTLLDLIVGIFCLVGFIKLNFKLKKPTLFIKTAFLFIIIAILSLLITPLKLNLSEYFVSSLYILRFFIFIFFGWLIFSGAFGSFKKNIIKVFLVSGIALSILGLFQLIFLPDLRFLTEFGWDPHYFRTASTFLDPNFLGSFLVLTLILLTSESFSPIFILIYLTLLTTFSRGAYLAFLISFLGLSLLNKSFKLAILTIILFLFLMAGFLAYTKIIAEPRGINREESAEFRLGTWQQGWQLFTAHPILGVGFNTYRYALRQYHLGDDKFLATHGASTNDSSLLYIAATTGIVGLVSYLFFFGSLLKFGIKQNYLLVTGLLALLTQSFFANTLFYPPLLLWLILTAVISPLSAVQKK